MKIYTKKGDDGTTGLFNGERVRKSELRVKTYGTVDELNSIVGLALSFDSPPEIRHDLDVITNMLFTVGSDLATPYKPEPKFEVERLKPEQEKWLEKTMDTYENNLKPLKNFILPGGTHCAAFLHNARTVCRRAERLIVELAEKEEVNEGVIVFMNRLSDYFFMAARYANHLAGVEDRIWKRK